MKLINWSKLSWTETTNNINNKLFDKFALKYFRSLKIFSSNLKYRLKRSQLSF